MVDAIKARVTALSDMKKVPAGVSAAGLAEARGGLATLTQTWSEATAATQSGDFAAAVAKATEVKDRAGKVMTSLHMPAIAEMK